MLAVPKAALPASRRQPAGRKSQQRVKEILQAGRDVFSEKGYERATTAEIAQRLGVSEATVFSYFRGKRELCARVIGDWYDESIEAMEAGLPRDGTVRQQFAFIVRTHLRLMLESGTGICELVLSEGRSRHHDLGEALVDLQRRYTAPLMRVLARGQGSGQIRNDVPLRLLRSLVFGPMEHVLWDATLAHRRTDIEATAQRLVDVLWSALQPPNVELEALAQFSQEVGDALRRLERAPSTAARRAGADVDADAGVGTSVDAGAAGQAAGTDADTRVSADARASTSVNAGAAGHAAGANTDAAAHAPARTPGARGAKHASGTDDTGDTGRANGASPANDGGNARGTKRTGPRATHPGGARE